MKRTMKRNVGRSANGAQRTAWTRRRVEVNATDDELEYVYEVWGGEKKGGKRRAWKSRAWERRAPSETPINTN